MVPAKIKIAFGFLIATSILIVVAIASVGLSGTPAAAPNEEKKSRSLHPAPTSREEFIRRGCEIHKLRISDRPMSDLSLDDLQIYRACRAIGEW